jgi:hypothetical protein
MPHDEAGGPRAKVPRSAGQRERAVKAYARTRNLVEKRVRDWISYMALGGRLEAAAKRPGGGRHFTFKGGVVMEMRHHDGARATTDLDLTYIGPEQDPVRAIEDAIAEPYGRFSFRRTGKPLDMPNVNTVRVEIAVRFDGAA